jgi:hypothetical protein
MKIVYGWEDMHAEQYQELGVRLFGNCDTPDLEIFPETVSVIEVHALCCGT